MADALGVGGKMGIFAAGAWNTAYSAPTILIPFDSETLVQAYTRIQDESLVGSAGRAPSSQGVQAIVGQTVHRLDYNNFDVLLSMGFGTIATRTLTLSNDALLKYCWIELEKGTSRWRFGACKATKFMLSGEKDGIVMLTIDWICRDIDRNAAAFPSISPVGPRNHVRFEDLQIMIETIASGPPAGADTKRIESFELEIDNVLLPDDYASKSTTSPEEKYPLEPVRNGFRVVNFKIGLPRYDSDADFVTWKEADTPIQAQMLFSRSGENLQIDLPDLRFASGADAPIGGPERVKLGEVALECYAPAAGNPLYTGGEIRAIFT